MGRILAFFGAGGLQLKALVIAAIAMAVMVLALISWALLERTWRLQLEVEVVTLRAQSDILADSLGRCNVSIENAGKAGDAAVAETRRLVGLAEKSFEKQAALGKAIKDIVGKPAPVRADGKIKDCADGWAEIRARTQGGQP